MFSNQCFLLLYLLMAVWIGELKGFKFNFIIEMLGFLRFIYFVRKLVFLFDKVVNEYIFFMVIWKIDVIRFGIWYVEV